MGFQKCQHGRDTVFVLCTALGSFQNTFEKKNCSTPCYITVATLGLLHTTNSLPRYVVSSVLITAGHKAKQPSDTYVMQPKWLPTCNGGGNGSAGFSSTPQAVNQSSNGMKQAGHLLFILNNGKPPFSEIVSEIIYIVHLYPSFQRSPGRKCIICFEHTTWPEPFLMQDTI